MAGIRVHYSSGGKGPSLGGWRGSVIKGILTLFLAGILLLIILASATFILVALAGGMIGLVAFLVRRAFRGGKVPLAPPADERKPAVQEAIPTCPHCGSVVQRQIAGGAGDALICQSCGRSVRERDIVYVVI